MKTIDLNTRKIALRILSVAGVLLAIMLVLAFSSSNKDDQEQPVAAQSMPVEVAYPVYEKITEWDEYTGRFEASNRVEVRARVGGFLESVNFQDGQMVEKGDLSAGHARTLIGLNNSTVIAKKIIQKRLSVRQAEVLSRQFRDKKFKLVQKKDPNILDLQKSLEEKTGLGVTVNNKKNNSGTITFEYGSLDQLDRIINTIKKNY